MDLLRALRTRKSIRAFNPDPVPRSLITQVLEAARWSPSWGNTQPWELVVAGGGGVKRLTADLVAAFAGKAPHNPDVPMPAAFPDDYQHRFMACAAGLFGAMAIALGYPDPDSRANAFRTHREPLEKFVRWVDY